MPTPEERRQIDEIHGFRSAPPWTGIPTAIQVPSNNVYHSLSNGGNPFGKNPNNRNRRQTEPRVGNPTSSRTSTRASRDSYRGEGSSCKRRKIDDAPGHTFSSGKGYTAPKRGSPSRPLLAPEEYINVDDDSYDADPDERSSIVKNRKSSPDELNITSQPSSVSKYPFPQTSIQGRGKHKKTDIMPDGPVTEWGKKVYPYEDSDPIEDSNELPVHRKGQVKQAVERIDRLAFSPKIDLSKVQRPPNKAKAMKPKSQPTRAASQSTPNALQFDRIATSTTLSYKENGPLPIKAAFLESIYYPQSRGQRLQMFWASDSLSIKANESEVYRLRLAPASCKSFTCSETSSSSPVIQLKPVDGYKLVTVKFNDDDPQWRSKTYEKFTKMASKVAKVETTKNDEGLWEFASQAADQNKEAPGTSHEPDRMQVLKGIRERKVLSLQHLPENRKRKAPSVMHPSSPLTDPPSSPPAAPESNIVLQMPTKSRRENKPEFNPSNVRRSARIAPSQKIRPTDPDELILVYPPGPGAVNITKGDLDRLGPGEYLNDTLIEFGLKLWLKGLAETNPTLASQIHIFNSFFYKKLNHAKDVQQAFESVRKWTSKFDIFEKKYVIVPINEHLHWYLAIICEPEHVLSRRSSTTPIVRKQTRSTAQAGVAVSDLVATQNDIDDKDDQNITSSEAEVERNLNNDFQSSCTIENHDLDPGLPLDTAEDDDAKSSAALSYVTDEGEGLDRPNFDPPSPSTSVPLRGSEEKEGSPTTSSIDMAVESTEEVSALPKHVAVEASGPHQRRHEKRKGKGKADPEPDVLMVEDEAEEAAASSGSQRQTYIFVMDSLGTRHPQAVKKLSKYLVMEAKDKKEISDAGDAEGRYASVPVQPNFCDCGVYLLHFAQTFMSDPAHYTKRILSQPKHIANKERQDTWRDYQVAHMREDLATKIRQLSISWREERAKEEASMITDDDDIEIVEPLKKFLARRIRG